MSHELGLLCDPPGRVGVHHVGTPSLGSTHCVRSRYKATNRISESQAGISSFRQLWALKKCEFNLGCGTGRIALLSHCRCPRYLVG